jgi:hypothetical protein
VVKAGVHLQVGDTQVTLEEDKRQAIIELDTATNPPRMRWLDKPKRRKKR